MSLRERLRHDVEAAPWVVEEVKKLEAERDLFRGMLLWVLYHHQGGHSNIGQPIRKVLEIGEFDHMTPEQVAEARQAADIAMGEPHH